MNTNLDILSSAKQTTTSIVASENVVRTFILSNGLIQKIIIKHLPTSSLSKWQVAKFRGV